MKRFVVPQQLRDLLWEVDVYGRSFESRNLYDLHSAFCGTGNMDQEALMRGNVLCHNVNFVEPGSQFYSASDFDDIMDWMIILGGGIYDEDKAQTSQDEEVNRFLEVEDYDEIWHKVLNPKSQYHLDPNDSSYDPNAFWLVRKTFVHRYFSEAGVAQGKKMMLQADWLYLVWEIVHFGQTQPGSANYGEALKSNECSISHIRAPFVPPIAGDPILEILDLLIPGDMERRDQNGLTYYQRSKFQLADQLRQAFSYANETGLVNNNSTAFRDVIAGELTANSPGIAPVHGIDLNELGVANSILNETQNMFQNILELAEYDATWYKVLNPKKAPADPNHFYLVKREFIDQNGQEIK